MVNEFLAPTSVPVWDHRTAHATTTVRATTNAAVTPPTGATKVMFSIITTANERLYISVDDSDSNAQGVQIGGIESDPITFAIGPGAAFRVVNPSGGTLTIGIIYFYS